MSSDRSDRRRASPGCRAARRSPPPPSSQPRCRTTARTAPRRGYSAVRGPRGRDRQRSAGSITSYSLSRPAWPASRAWTRLWRRSWRALQPATIASLFAGRSASIAASRSSSSIEAKLLLKLPSQSRIIGAHRLPRAVRGLGPTLTGFDRAGICLEAISRSVSPRAGR